MRAVKFIRAHLMYQPGEIAGFEDGVADGLIAGGIARDPAQTVETEEATPDVVAPAGGASADPAAGGDGEPKGEVVTDPAAGGDGEPKGEGVADAEPKAPAAKKPAGAKGKAGGA